MAKAVIILNLVGLGLLLAGWLYFEWSVRHEPRQ